MPWWIREPLQWWWQPLRLFELLPQAIAGSKKHQFKIALMYAGGWSGSGRDVRSPPSSPKGGGEAKKIVIIGNKQPDAAVLQALELARQNRSKKLPPVCESAGDALRWCKLAAEKTVSGGDVEQGLPEAKKMISRLKQMI